MITFKLVADLKASFLSGTSTLHNLVERRLQVRESKDLNWPAYGLERYFLHVFLSTWNPRYNFSHLVTPATRRILVSAAVSGFQTVLLEYLWPKGAPDNKFLQYLYSRTEKNVHAYSVHRVLSDTRFFNLDKVYAPNGSGFPDAVDLQVLMLARPKQYSPVVTTEVIYGGDTRHAPGSAGWELAANYFSNGAASRELPPDSCPTFKFDLRTIGFSEKVALIFRGEFDVLPLCRALPFGHYYRTEEIVHPTTEGLAPQPGHVILFDFPALRVSQLDEFLDEMLRNPEMTTHCESSLLVEQNLAFVDGVALARINPLRANPYHFAGGYYIHLPKRQMRDGKWHTLPLLEQVGVLNQDWQKRKL